MKGRPDESLSLPAFDEIAPIAAVVYGMERETGIEPATNSLEGCDSTIELLPPILI